VVLVGELDYSAVRRLELVEVGLLRGNPMQPELDGHIHELLGLASGEYPVRLHQLVHPLCDASEHLDGHVGTEAELLTAPGRLAGERSLVLRDGELDWRLLKWHRLQLWHLRRRLQAGLL
ncbi:hypothetical protein PMAYCL1PPCAC_03783, partial [Pristionchus mayeri]